MIKNGIFFVFQITRLAELLDYVGDGGLPHLERRSDVYDARVALVLNQFVDALQVVFGALAGRFGRHKSIKHSSHEAASDGLAALESRTETPFGCLLKTKAKLFSPHDSIQCLAGLFRDFARAHVCRLRTKTR